MWISDDEGVIGLPRVGIEAVSESWDKRGLQVNLGFPDGRAVIVREAGAGRSVVDDDGVCRTFARRRARVPVRRAVQDADHDLRRHRVRHHRGRDGSR